jgi:hypothetical protein
LSLSLIKLHDIYQPWAASKFLQQALQPILSGNWCRPFSYTLHLQKFCTGSVHQQKSDFFSESLPCRPKRFDSLVTGHGYVGDGSDRDEIFSLWSGEVVAQALSSVRAGDIPQSLTLF